MNDPDANHAASHRAPTRPAARIEMLATPIPSTKLPFLIATICKCIGGRSFRAFRVPSASGCSGMKCGVTRDTFGPLADRPPEASGSRASQKISPFLASLPPCILASSQPCQRLRRFGIEDFVGRFGPEDGQGIVGEQANLLQDGGLVPVDVFVGEFAVAEVDDGDERNFDAAIGGGDAGEHPGNFARVREGKNHLVDELILADGARDGSKRGVRRHAGNEIAGIEAAQRGFAVAASHRRNVVDVGILGHGGERRFRVARREFVRRVFFP